MSGADAEALLEKRGVRPTANRILVLRGSHVYMDGTPRQVFRRASDLEEVGLDVPQATKIALALRRMGLDIDTAVYTVDELEQALLSLRGEAGVC